MRLVSLQYVDRILGADRVSLPPTEGTSLWSSKPWDEEVGATGRTFALLSGRVRLMVAREAAARNGIADPTISSSIKVASQASLTVENQPPHESSSGGQSLFSQVFGHFVYSHLVLLHYHSMPPLPRILCITDYYRLL